MKRILSIFRKDSQNRSQVEEKPDGPAFEISQPYDFKSNFHVGYNKETREYIGLPETWAKWLDASLTIEERQVIQYSILRYFHFV